MRSFDVWTSFETIILIGPVGRHQQPILLGCDWFVVIKSWQTVQIDFLLLRFLLNFEFVEGTMVARVVEKVDATAVGVIAYIAYIAEQAILFHIFLSTIIFFAQLIGWNQIANQLQIWISQLVLSHNQI